VSVTFARGFSAAGVAAGLKPSGALDLALLVGAAGTTATGLFTTNKVVAAPVQLARARLDAGHGTAVLVNSGQANAATGPRGAGDALRATDAAAALLHRDSDDVVPCSTGVIGEPIHMPELLAALPGLVDSVAPDGDDDFAHAILTTDTVSKQATATAGQFRVGGAAKGVGMISPNLATMLAFVTLDAAVARGHLSRLADDVLRDTFNSISVDGCTSTNDTVVVLASAAAGGSPVTPGTTAWDGLATAVGAVGESLARQLIHDGEGATHVLLIDVVGAADENDARAVAKAVADSPLVKTAAFGEDANPGRILQAAGAAGVDLDADRLDVWIGDVQVAAGGTIDPDSFAHGGSAARAKPAMAAPEVSIRLRVGDGPGAARVLGCDLSYDYVKINGEYTT